LIVRSGRCLLVGLVLLGHLAGALGVPVPVRAVKESAVPFPCQNHPCGCMTAQQCWDHCCCFTHEQKLAWAQEHQVQPPQTTLAGWNQPRQRDQANCCCGKDHKAAPTAKAKPAGTRWIIGMSARQCRGDGPSWLTGHPAPPPPPFVAWHFDWSFAGWLQPSAVSSPFAELAPSSPPPRS
jgi:hypothetical protein